MTDFFKSFFPKEEEKENKLKDLYNLWALNVNEADNAEKLDTFARTVEVSTLTGLNLSNQETFEQIMKILKLDSISLKGYLVQDKKSLVNKSFVSKLNIDGASTVVEIEDKVRFFRAVYLMKRIYFELNIKRIGYLYITPQSELNTQMMNELDDVNREIEKTLFHAILCSGTLILNQNKNVTSLFKSLLDQKTINPFFELNSGCLDFKNLSKFIEYRIRYVNHILENSLTLTSFTKNKTLKEFMMYSRQPQGTIQTISTFAKKSIGIVSSKIFTFRNLSFVSVMHWVYNRFQKIPPSVLVINKYVWILYPLVGLLLRNLLDRDWNDMKKQFRIFSIKVLFNKFVVANLWNATKQKIQSFSIKNLPLKQILILIILILVQSPLAILIAVTFLLYVLISSSDTFMAIKARLARDKEKTEKEETEKKEDYCDLLIKIVNKIQGATEMLVNPIKEMFIKFIEPLLPVSTSARFICFILIIIPFVLYKVIGLSVLFQLAEKAGDSLFNTFETIVEELTNTCSDLYKIYVVSSEKSKDLFKQVLDLLVNKNPIVCIFKKQRPDILNCFDFLFEKANNSTEIQMGLTILSPPPSTTILFETSNLPLFESSSSSAPPPLPRPIIKVPTPGVAGGVTTSPTPSTDWKKCLKEVFLDFNLECAKKLLQEGIVWCEKNIVSLMLSPPIPVGIYNVLVLLGFVTMTILNYISKTRETGKVMFEKSVQEIVLAQSANDILRTFSGPIQELLEPCRLQESVLTGKIKMESFYGAFDKFENINKKVLSTWLSSITFYIFKEKEEERVTVLINRTPTRVSPFFVTYFNNKKWNWPYFLDLSEGEFDNDDEEEIPLEYLEDQNVIIPEMIFSSSSSTSVSSSRVLEPFRGRGQILGKKRSREREEEREDENLLVLEQTEQFIRETRTGGELGRGMKTVDDLTFYLQLADVVVKKAKSPYFRDLEHIPVTKRDKAKCILALVHANNIFPPLIKLDSESFKQCTTLVTGRMSIVSFILQIAGIGTIVENTKGTFLKQRDRDYLLQSNNLLKTLYHFKEETNVIKKLFTLTGSDGLTEEESLQLRNIKREINASSSSDETFFPEFDAELDRANPYKSCYRLFLSLSRVSLSEGKEKAKKESFKRYCRFIGLVQIIYNETSDRKRQQVLDNFLERYKLPVRSLKDIERYNFFRPFGENIYFTDENVFRGPNEFNCLLSEKNINKKTTLYWISSSELEIRPQVLQALNEILLDHPDNDAFSNSQTLVNFLKMLE